MPLVFMYGPDAVQGRMFDRLGPTDVRGPAILSGYRLVFDKPNMKNPKEGLPNLREEDGADAFGVVFELQSKQIEMLDGFFGGYEQQRMRPTLMKVTKPDPDDEAGVALPPPEEGGDNVTAIAWVARRTGKRLVPSFEGMEATLEGLEENGAPERFADALKEVETLPSENVELMVQFERGFAEDDAKTLMSAAGGTIRRRMRTDHEDQVMLLVKIPRNRVDAVETDLGKHPSVTLVERNAGGYEAL